MISDVPGVLVGHWTNPVAKRGCTVVLFPEGTVASGEIRGGAPATREFGLLAPTALVQGVDAVVLSGGSAFGLAAADGVMRWCEENGVGFPTATGPVPIVVAMCVFDLPVGDPEIRPTAEHGYQASAAASVDFETGAVGAGAGCRVGKWRGAGQSLSSAIVSSSVVVGEVVVGALVAVNAFGDIEGYEPDDRIWPGQEGASGAGFTSTTVGVVATNAALTKVECRVVAEGAHDGLARAVSPPHTRVDGDAFVAAATGSVRAHVDTVRWMAVQAVDEAIRSVPASLADWS
ncbi:MAG: putative aminopeptidase [Acidimicrobiales bacterium]|nr:MAG: peptidase S58 family protein [Actinomycetota bacterium]MBV6507946.1 putative aminopeptidase [Acidimicrobiales bacterium]RIK06976.1 MAG: peptidase S58 family protein [Acidobacteriota bacterium]